MKPIKYKALAKLLRSLDCEHVRTKGDHEIWRAPDGSTTTIPVGKSVAPGTAREIRNHLTESLGDGWLGDLEK